MSKSLQNNNTKKYFSSKPLLPNLGLSSGSTDINPTKSFISKVQSLNVSQVPIYSVAAQLASGREEFDSLSASNIATTGSFDGPVANISSAVNVGSLQLSQSKIVGTGEDITISPPEGSKVIIDSNLEILGSLTRIKTVSTVVSDPVIVVGHFVTDEDTPFVDEHDRGIELKWVGGTNENPIINIGFMGYDKSADRWVFYSKCTKDDTLDKYERINTEISKFDLDEIHTNKIQSATYHATNRNLDLTSTAAMNLTADSDVQITSTTSYVGVESLRISGTDIGLSSDTDLLNFADNTVTVRGGLFVEGFLSFGSGTGLDPNVGLIVDYDRTYTDVG